MDRKNKRKAYYIICRISSDRALLLSQTLVNEKERPKPLFESNQRVPNGSLSELLLFLSSSDHKGHGTDS